jgi:hypothetical protein
MMCGVRIYKQVAAWGGWAGAASGGDAALHGWTVVSASGQVFCRCFAALSRRGNQGLKMQ